MINQPNIFRSLLIYGICLPLAIVLGWMLTGSQETIYYLKYGQGHLTPTIVIFGLVLAVLLSPLFLRFHHVFLLCCWNMSAVLFFIKGRPDLWLGLTAISFLISIGHRTLDKHFRFISVPEVTRPLLALAFVVLVTAVANGGFGLRTFGGDVVGGKRYFILFGAIIGYFAITSQKIPAKYATLVTAIFFLGGTTNLIGDLVNFGNGTLIQLLLVVFPSSAQNTDFVQLEATRFLGLSSSCAALFAFFMSRYGVLGIFTTAKPWRWILFLFVCFAGMLGGFRSYFIAITFNFAIIAWLEGAHRTKLLPIFLFIFVTAATVCVPFLNKLPPTIQRTMAFLPVPIDPVVRMDAQSSTDWRLRMWKSIVPLVPQYLLLGKGYGLSAQDFVSSQVFRNQIKDEDWRTSAVAGDYHNGPLSVIITFGIWGTIAFIWFIAAALRVLHHNYRYGDSNLRVVNTFLFGAFIAHLMVFIFIFGGLQSDMRVFIGYLGLSISLNGGKARPVPETEPVAVKSPIVINALSRPRPAFGQSTRIG